MPVPDEIRSILSDDITERGIEMWWRKWQANNPDASVRDGIQAARELARYLQEGTGYYV